MTVHTTEDAPRSRSAQRRTCIGFTQTEAKPYFLASSQSRSMSAYVASGRSRVWSMRRARSSGTASMPGEPMRRTSRAPPMKDRGPRWCAWRRSGRSRRTGRRRSGRARHANVTRAEDGREQGRVRRQDLDDRLDERLVVAGACCHVRGLLAGGRARPPSSASIIATRRLWRSALQSVERKTSTILSAVSSLRYPAPSVTRCASLCSRAFFAVATSKAIPARTPGTLLATMPEPIPAPSTTTPRHASPRATFSAAARAKTG